MNSNLYIRCLALFLLFSLFHCEGRVRSSTDLTDTALPSTETIMQWIRAIEGQGLRRPGYSADTWTEDWAVSKFKEFGLEDVRKEPIKVLSWRPQHWSLEAWHPDSEASAARFDASPIPYSAATNGLEGSLVMSSGGAGTQDLYGKVAVVNLSLKGAHQSMILKKFAIWSYDASDEFARSFQQWPVTDRFQKIMEPEIEAGAIAFLGILNFPWETNQFYVPYDGKPRSIPGMYLSEQEGRRLLELMRQGPTRVRMVNHRRQAPAKSFNIVGTLKGNSEFWIIFGSHHDGPWNSAVEDASGVAMVLAQAYYWSRVPPEKRPFNMLFLLNGGHMAGGVGLKDFVESHLPFIREKTVLEIHLEHIAREAKTVDGRLVPTDRPEIRWWFTTYSPVLQSAVSDAICHESIARSLIMPVEGFPSPERQHPPTDAAYFHPETPIVSLLSAPMYLFDPADRIEMIHEDSLVPITRAVIRIVNGIRSQTPGSIRATITSLPVRKPDAGCKSN